MLGSQILECSACRFVLRRISEGDEVVVELVEGAGPSLSHGFVHGVEGALLGGVGVEGRPLEVDGGLAVVFDEGAGGEHLEGPVGDVGMAGYVAVFVGEGVDEDDALGRDDLPKDPFSPHFDAVGGAQAVVEGAAGDEVEMADGDGEAFGAEPLLEVLLFGPGGEDQFAWGFEGAGDGEFAVVLAAFWMGALVAGGQWGNSPWVDFIITIKRRSGVGGDGAGFQPWWFCWLRYPGRCPGLG